MKAILFILLAFGPFLIFAVRGLMDRSKAEEITLKGVEVFIHWFISLIILTFLIKLVGLSLTTAVVAVILHHIVWVLVAYYGEERSWKFIKDVTRKLFNMVGKKSAQSANKS